MTLYKCRLNINHFPRIDRGLIQRAAEQFVVVDQAVLAVEPEHAEDFEGQGGQLEAQPVAHCTRGGEDVLLLQISLEGAAGQFHRRRQLGSFGRAQALEFCQVLRRPAGKDGQLAIAGGQQVPRQIHRTLALDADAEKYGQQFRIGKCPSALGQQAFPGAFPFRPVGDCHRG